MRDYTKIQAWKLADDLTVAIYQATKSFPREELYSLTDQVRRASRSVGANIAEAWQKRRYPASFVSKLADSDGEQAETQHWIDTSLACGFINQPDHDDALERCREIGRMLGSMMAAPEKFCHTPPTDCPPSSVLRRRSSVL